MNNKKCYTKRREYCSDWEENVMGETMKTLYEILEVSETASQEIIEKAYKTLAKKYHPDLQPEEKKQEAEHQMKVINEAYETLGNETKRSEYDKKLAEEREIKAQAEQIKKEQDNRKSTQNSNSNANQKNGQTQAYYTQSPYEQQPNMTQEEYAKMQKQYQKAQQEMQKNMQAEYERKYQKAYEDYLRSLGYKIKYKWTWKNYKDLLITILVIAVICAIIWIIPPTRNWIVSFYESNAIVKTVVDVISRIFVGIWNAICSIFQ